MYALATLLSLLAVTCFIARVRPARPQVPGAVRDPRRAARLHAQLGAVHPLRDRRRVPPAARAIPRAPPAPARRRSWPTARSSSCTPRGSRRCSSSPPHTAAPWSTAPGLDKLMSALLSVFGGAADRPAAPPRRRCEPGRADLRPAHQAAGPRPRAGPGRGGRSAPQGGRVAPAHRPRRAARRLAVLAGRARLHDALLRGHRRAGDGPHRRRTVQRPRAGHRRDHRPRRSCGGTTGRASSTGRATSATSPRARSCGRSTPATSWSPRTPSRSRCCTTTSAAASATPTRWAWSPTRRSWTGATRSTA